MSILLLDGLRPPRSSSKLGVLVLAVLAIGAVACENSVGGAGAGGGAGSTNAGGNAGSTNAGGDVVSACDSPTALLQPDGSDSGYVKCADGSVNRVAKVACVLQNMDTCQGDEQVKDCTTSADCTAKPNGVCLHIAVSGPGYGTCGCVYQCETDDDCGGKACICAGVSQIWATEGTSFCAADGDCSQPSDCASGQCGLGEWETNCYVNSHMNCRTPDDECRSNTDCKTGDTSPGCEKMDVTGTWKCHDPTCTI